MQMNKYLIWKEESNFDEAVEIEAPGKVEAAEIWAKNYDSNNSEFYIANGNTVRVYVAEKDKMDDKGLFDVFGYPVPTYEVSPV
jgi:hypothetical protein